MELFLTNKVKYGKIISMIQYLILIVLIINGHLISLLNVPVDTSITPEKDGYASITNWYGGTMVYAHNYLSGDLFNEIETVKAIKADGTVLDLKIKQIVIVPNEDWEESIIKYSSLDTITLVTCYYDNNYRVIVQLVESVDNRWSFEEVGWQRIK